MEKYIVQVKARDGSNKKDKFYIEEETRLRFLSKKDVERYIADGNTSNCKKQPQLLDEQEMKDIKQGSQIEKENKTTPIEETSLQSPSHDRGECSEATNLRPSCSKPIEYASDEEDEKHATLENSKVTPTDAFVVSVDVTSFPIWNNERDLEDESYWASKVVGPSETHDDQGLPSSPECNCSSPKK